MKVGITLPAMIPDTPAGTVLEWARRADAGPFSSIASGERLVWPGHDLMTILAAAAAVTERVRLISTVVVLPFHSGAIVAKQAATIDAISKGRLSLGVGIGGRDDDYRAAGAGFERRHARMQEQVDLMRRIWRGEPAGPGLGAIGPRPIQADGPEILAGSVFPDAIRRVAAWADGLSAWSFEPNIAALAESYRIMQDAWTACARPGRPRFVAGFWYALGPGAEAQAQSYARTYLGYFGKEVAAGLATALQGTSAAAVKDILRALADIGTDEVTLVPTSADLDQLERAADLLG